MPELAKDLIKIRNRLRKEYRRNLNPAMKMEINALQREIKRIIKEHGTDESWETLTENLTAADNSLWRVAKKLKGTEHHMSPLTTRSGVAVTEEEKAEAIADSIGRKFTPHPAADPVLARSMEEEVEEYLKQPPSTTIPFVDLEELRFFKVVV